VHHDALELANGRIVLVTNLREGQHATVLQLPTKFGKTDVTRSSPEAAEELAGA
jgi:hypothetical protein